MNRILLFLVLFCYCATARGQNRYDQFAELAVPIDAADWITLWDTSASGVRKISPANLLASRQPLDSDLTEIAGLADPNADRLLFWDDSKNGGVGGWEILTLDSTFTFTATTLSVALPAGRLGFGSAGGLMTSDADLLYNTGTDTLSGIGATFNNVKANTVLRLGASNFSLSSDVADHFAMTADGTGDDLVFDLDTDNAARLYSGAGVVTLTLDGINLIVPTEVYDATGWNGDLSVPTKDAVRDKIESIAGGSLTATHIGYGSGGGTLTGEASFTYDAVNNIAYSAHFQADSFYINDASADNEFEFRIASDPSADRQWSWTLPDGDVNLEVADTGGDPIVLRQGTVPINSWTAPNTTTPLSVTWPTANDAVLYQGITGELDLPPVADYSGRTLVIVSTGTYTVTVDPNGTNQIIDTDGASLGAGTADVVSATIASKWSYFSDGFRWLKFEGGTGTASSVAWGDVTGTPTTLGGYGITDAQPLSSNLTALAAQAQTAHGLDRLDDLGPATFSGTGTYLAGGIYTGTMNADATLTMTLSAGQSVQFKLIGSGGPHTLTFPAARRNGYSSTTTTMQITDNNHSVVFYQSATDLWVGDTVEELLDLANDVTGTLPVANGGTGNTVGPGKANVLGDADVGITTNPYTLTAANSYGTAIFYEPAAAGEIDLPAGVAGMNILIRNNSANTIDIDPNGSEAIERDGTLQTGGVTLQLSAGAGNFVGLLHDGVRWTTWGYRGTLSAGS